MKEMLPNPNFYKKLKFFYLIALGAILTFGGSQLAFAQQNVGIGTAAPDASAVLDIVSASKGVLVPRLTTANRDAIVSPKSGLLVYNTDDLKFNYFNGTIWVNIAGGVTWFSGQGQPTRLDFAKLNDLYLDELTGAIYQRAISQFPPAVLSWNRLSFDKNNKKEAALTGVADVNGGSYSVKTFAFPGAATTDAVLCTPSFNLPDGIIISHAWVSANDVISVKFYNTTAGSIAINGNYKLVIF